MLSELRRPSLSCRTIPCPLCMPSRFGDTWLAASRAFFVRVVAARLSGPSGSLPMTMLVDSGADSSVIDLPLANRLGLALEEASPGRGLTGRPAPAWRPPLAGEGRPPG